MDNGSLAKHLFDELHGHDWKTRYKVIKGTCEGLRYLHEGLESPMYHLDLKPDNILLDKDMVPKLADFGLSKLVDNNQTLAFNVSIGTSGYLPPEFIEENLVSNKLDIFSLGVVMIRIITGYEGYHKKAEMSSQEFIEVVCKKWSKRLHAKSGSLSPEAECHQVKRCIEIALDCVHADRRKRPTIGDIIRWLDEIEPIEATSQLVEIDYTKSPGSGIGKLLDVHPLELRFPFEQNKYIQCPLTLANRTDHHVGFLIIPSIPETHSILSFQHSWGEPCWNDIRSSFCSGLGPHSSMVIYVTMGKQQSSRLLQGHMGLFKVVMIPTGSKEDLKMLDSDLTYHIKANRSKDLLLKIVKKFVTEVHGRRLRVVLCDPAKCKEVVTTHNQLIPATGEEFGRIQCMDVHPIETWVLVGHEAGNVCIWNYATQERVMVFNVRDFALKKCWSIIYSTKFVAGEQWFAAGDGSGLVHVYAYTTKDKVKEFEAHYSTAVSSLAVHPTDPLLLTASWGDKSIKLWNWGQGWVCTRVFDAIDTVWQLTIGPKDTNTFASYSRCHTKVWNIHALNNPIATLEPSGEPTFYTNSHRHFLVTTRLDSDNKAIIWDLLTNKHVHTLRVTRELRGDWVACHHNTLPILATIMALHGSGEKQIFFWDSRNYRLMKKVEFSMTGSIVCMVFDGTEGLTSIVVASTRGISIIKINVLALLNHGWS